MKLEKVTKAYSKDNVELLLHIQQWLAKGYKMSKLVYENNQFKDKPIYAEFELWK
ncbi:MAG: hypothetical protein GY861_05360 [bacterium]|nr:hypothetical protein [bacterium]